MQVDITANEQLATWKSRDDKLSKALIWIYIINFIIILLASSVAGVVVLVIRRRKDCFVVTALVCYFASSTIVLSVHAYFHYAETYSRWADYVLQIARFCYLMAHWAFSA